jgi:uncharacterized membrane protein YkoI
MKTKITDLIGSLVLASALGVGPITATAGNYGVATGNGAGYHSVEDEESDDNDTARELRQQGVILPLEQLVAALPHPQPLRILEAEMERERGRLIYELEVLDAQGQVWEVELDAVTGRLLESEVED